MNLRALVKKWIELIAVPAVILILGVLRFEATLMWLMWPALAIGGGGFAWWSVLQARTRVVTRVLARVGGGGRFPLDSYWL